MFFLPLLLAAQPAPVQPVAADTVSHLDIEEAVVVASPKETAQLRRQPLSVSLYDSEDLTRLGAHSIKDLSAYAPGLYMPDYGSRLTSAVYIRGIGSRIGTPAVGLYVDNVPYIDKSAYDFNFLGIDRVDVLRGPQGTLYGRNTMGGLVRVFTADPITHKGTEVSAGIRARAAGEENFAGRAAFTTYLHPADKMGISLGGYYEGDEGFFTNSATGRKQDDSKSGGGRVRWSWQPTNIVKLDWTASYEYSDEGACPYYRLGAYGKDGAYQAAADEVLAQNRPSRYRRSLFNTGLGVEHRLPRVVMTSLTAYQHLDDRLFMDQDFTAADIFSLEQKQMMNTVSEEIALRSPRSDSRWTWTTGAFGMYQYLRTKSPVTFYGDGLSFLNRQIASVLPEGMGMTLALTGETLPFTARLETPSVNAALFHQSTVRLVGGLSMTLGVRLDYDYRELRLTSGTAGAATYNFNMPMLRRLYPNGKDLTANPALDGNLYNDSWQVLPKGSLNYAFREGLGNIYFSVAKGYRAGGYNIQSYSDLSQTVLRRSIMTGVRDFSVETINAMPLPQASKDKAIAAMTAVIDAHTPAQPDLSTLYYKPEYTWSYELGTHLNLLDRALQLDLSTFYMKTRDQQIARFAASGLGRETVNAGRSRSCGVEVSLRSLLLADRLNLSATYGYTDAVFTNYNLGQNAAGQTVDYTDNRVPFVPAHTFSAAADFRQPLRAGFLKALSLGADVKGAGDVQWNEANTFSQPFYAVLSARLGLELGGDVTLSLWARNLTDTRYATFSFDNLSQRYAEYGRPRHFGFDVKWKF